MAITVKLERKPEKEITLEKITIFLGANGSGKSQLLRDIKLKISSSIVDQNLIYVEGGRVITLPSSLVQRSDLSNRNDTLEDAEKNYQKRKLNTLSGRVQTALTLLEKKRSINSGKVFGHNA